jgi:hypothetical protein
MRRRVPVFVIPSRVTLQSDAPRFLGTDERSKTPE